MVVCLSVNVIQQSVHHEGTSSQSYAWQVSQDTEGVPPPPPGYQYVSLAATQGNCLMPMGQDNSLPQTAYLQAVKPSQMSMQSSLLGAGQGQAYYQTPEELFAYQWAATVSEGGRL